MAPNLFTIYSTTNRRFYEILSLKDMVFIFRLWRCVARHIYISREYSYLISCPTTGFRALFGEILEEDAYIWKVQTRASPVRIFNNGSSHLKATLLCGNHNTSFRRVVRTMWFSFVFQLLILSISKTIKLSSSNRNLKTNVKHIR